MIKAIFFDVDGTLIPMGGNKVTDSAVDAIKTLQSKGVKIVICTGRHISEVGKSNDVLTSISPDGIISTTGSYCVDEKGIPFYTNPMNEVQKEKILKLFNDRKFSVELKTELGVYINYVSPLCESIKLFYNDKPREVSTYKGEEIYQGLIYVEPNVRKTLEQEIPELKFTSWNPRAIDLIPPNSGKTLGIQKYLEKENIKIEESMAFGDGENDIDMLKYVGIGVAMGNSAEEVRKNADYITDNCENDGIYNALKHFELI